MAIVTVASLYCVFGAFEDRMEAFCVKHLIILLNLTLFNTIPK